MLATLIASAPKASEEKAPTAATAALPCKNFLRCMFIDLSPSFAKTPSDQIFLQDGGADRVFRIDHVTETDTPGLTEQHVGVDLVESVIGTHPAHQLAVGDAGRILERSSAPNRHQEVLRLEAGPGESPALDDVELEGNGGALFDCDARKLAVTLRGMAIADIEQT